MQPDAFLELDDGDVVGRVGEERRMLRPVHDDEGVDRPASREGRPFVLLGEALGTENRRRKAQVTTGGAALDGEPALTARGPVGRAVLGDGGERLVGGQNSTSGAVLWAGRRNRWRAEAPRCAGFS